MKTDFDLTNKLLLKPVVFRPDFNSQADVISTNQAWSLFFTAGNEDKALGFNAEVGQFFTNLLVAVGVAGVLWVFLFGNIL